MTTKPIAKLFLGLGTVAVFTLPPRAGAGPAGPGKPEDVGMSSEPLARVKEAVQRQIEAGALPGAVTRAARRGKVVHFEAHGLNDVEAKKPMPKDAIFRLASMSKPITAVAVMMMIEEGKVRLSDPVSRFIPEFKQAMVAVPKQGATPPAGGGRGGGRGGPPPEVDLVQSLPITIRDLL